MFDPTVREGVLRVRQPGARWLSTGWNGGYETADAAFNVSVPEGWERTDLDEYTKARRKRAEFHETGPTLLTGVDMAHLRGARLDGVVAYATAGVSNPATLPMDPSGAPSAPTAEPESGTVNVVLCTDWALADDALATLLAVVVEAKTATLLSETGFTGTTTDAVVVGSDPAGEEATFAGSATAVGRAARACVREAVQAALTARYADDPEKPMPESVDDAKYGVVTADRATTFDPQNDD
ncbi:adenosylcobinamide amidohydrolase [Haladaptatus sp. YSMS36]|uniref:adenosylcobinamide amidohydrolase n=1 Tax=Haladaptatus sp. YSMS36 TaxID=3033384 RepID=UPI0023E8D797|nr:adenosylcobinamide amidohydrolase [Haladaptatus sp. YSMS36]